MKSGFYYDYYDFFSTVDSRMKTVVDYYDYYDFLGPCKGGFKDEVSSFWWIILIIMIIMISLALVRVHSRMKSQDYCGLF